MTTPTPLTDAEIDDIERIVADPYPGPRGYEMHFFQFRTAVRALLDDLRALRAAAPAPLAWQTGPVPCDGWYWLCSLSLDSRSVWRLKAGHLQPSPWLGPLPEPSPQRETT